MRTEEYKKSNREQRMTPKAKGAFWCPKCDRQLVHSWEKCPACGYRSGLKTLKKDT